jgi:hypothetical protein
MIGKCVRERRFGTVQYQHEKILAWCSQQQIKPSPYIRGHCCVKSVVVVVVCEEIWVLKEEAKEFMDTSNCKECRSRYEVVRLWVRACVRSDSLKTCLGRQGYGRQSGLVLLSLLVGRGCLRVPVLYR